MSKPTSRAASLLTAMIAPLLALMLLASCTVDSPPDDFVHEVGAVEGYVLVAGQGTALDINARSLVTGGTRVTSSTESDSTGWYRLDLPTGFYRLETELWSGGRRVSAYDDSVEVGPGVLHRDLLRGVAEIGIRVPPELEGRHCSLRLDGLFSTYSDSRASAIVSDGLLGFTLPALQPGDYRMQLEGLGQNLYLPGTLMSAEADTLTVGAQDTAVYTLDLAGAYATISGAATGSWQSALSASLGVYAVSEGGMLLAVAGCAQDGTFVLGLFTPQDVRLRFVSSGVEQWCGGDSFETASVFPLRPGDHITGVTYVESGIEVRLEGPGHQFEYRAEVFVRDETGREFQRDTVYGNPFVICNLRPGRHYLRLEGLCDDQIWASQWYDGAPGPADAVPIDLQPGELRQVVINLVEGGRISGDLLTHDGDRPEYARIGIHDGAGDPLCGYPSYVEEGVYSFRGLADGDYYLAADLLGDDVWWYPGTTVFAEASAIVISGFGTVSDLDWSLPASTGKARP